jgi:hypothetical protein
MLSSIRYVHTNHTLGVKVGSANARGDQNVMLGSVIDVAAEGQQWRISGNRIGVFPDGMRDYIVPFAEPGRIMEGAVEIGRGASDCVVGTDGDGVNDAEERNIFGGVPDRRQRRLTQPERVPARARVLQCQRLPRTGSATQPDCG